MVTLMCGEFMYSCIMLIVYGHKIYFSLVAFNLCIIIQPANTLFDINHETVCYIRVLRVQRGLAHHPPPQKNG